VRSSSVKITGLKETDANLGLLSKATGRNVLMRVLTRAGQPIADRASELAPDDPETGAPDLHRSIVVSPSLKNPTGKAEYAAVLSEGGTKGEAVQALRDARRAGGDSFAEVFVGPTADQHHAHLQEFGTDHHGPHPFMRPAFDEKGSAALEIIRSDLGGEVDKAVSRMRRREAKKAAG
jgi:HK97 gp10 family phage protein